jgi:hypothetical protein
VAKEKNWHKHVAIGTYVLIGLNVVITALQYVRPPDPNHPVTLDFLSKSLTLTPALLFPLLVLVAAVAVTATLWTRPRPIISQTAPVMTPQLFKPHPTALDLRVTSPTAGITYTAKLRLSFENISGQSVRVLPPKWLTAEGNISVQCGASPFPSVPYTEGMVAFAAFYQLEEHLGSWKKNQWRRVNNKDDEHEDLNVEPGQTFRVWVGLNPCVPPNTMESLRKTNSLGTLILPVVIGSQTVEWKQEV